MNGFRAASDWVMRHSLDALEDSLLTFGQPVNSLGSFAMSRDLVLNARVIPAEGGRANYTLTRGLMIGLQEVALALAALPSFVREVPLDEATIHARGPMHRYRYVNYRQVALMSQSELAKGGIFGLRTTDPRRAPIAASMANMMRAFVLLHEQGHHLCGHLEFLLARNATRKGLQELHLTQQPSAEEAAELRALEFQADQFACIAMLAPVWQENQGAKIPEPLFRSPSGWLRVCTLSMVAVGCLLARAEAMMRPSGPRTHPTPLARLLSWRDAVIHVAHELFPHERNLRDSLCAINQDIASVIALIALGFENKFNDEAIIEARPERLETRDRLTALRSELALHAGKTHGELGLSSPIRSLFQEFVLGQ